MNNKTIYKKAKNSIRNFPITLNFLLFAALMWCSFYVLDKKTIDPKEDVTDNYQPLIMLMAKAALWFVLVLILISLVSTIIAWWRFKHHYKNGKTRLELNLEQNSLYENKLQIYPFIQKVWRPILGFISGRMLLENNNFSEKFILASNRKKNKNLDRSGVYGTNTLFFEDIKEYEVKGAYLYFEDMLRLISLPVKQPLGGSFYQPPIAKHLNESHAQPRSTEEMEVRIEQLRKVEGEYLNYKNFEFGDDVRRIVWKIYGKNRELVVRRPEIMNPYASHIYMYASFYSSFNTVFQESEYATAMLNYYKNAVWSLFQQLNEQAEYDVKFIAEQKISDDENKKYEERVQRSIANAEWQSYLDIQHYFDTKKGAVICINSFSDSHHVAQLLDSINDEVYVFYVRLSNCFKDNTALTWMKKIFFIDPDQTLKKLKATWVLSPLKFQLNKNENAIESLLQKHGIAINH